MLFEPALPDGMRYQADFLTHEEERALLDEIRQVTFAAFEMRGVVARRRVAFFGETYDRALAGAAWPSFLLELRPRLSAWADVPAEAFGMALINEYPPGAPIGWHRDAPQYGLIVGLSLLSPCRMRLRPYVSPAAARTTATARRRATHEIELAPRSCYLIAGAARSEFEHSIPPVREQRYSITFRTLRR